MPDSCPNCGAPEVDAMTPRTVYSCGSSDYDQRPGTFVRGTDCRPLQRPIYSEALRMLATRYPDHANTLANSARVIEDLQAKVAELTKFERRMHWLHDCSTGIADPKGYEWGIYRVKWEKGQPVEVWQTNSDFSDLDAEMERELKDAQESKSEL